VLPTERPVTFARQGEPGTAKIPKHRAKVCSLHDHVDSDQSLAESGERGRDPALGRGLEKENFEDPGRGGEKPASCA
jgi:hypothetical protein